jgi:hypothetical protein
MPLPTTRQKPFREFAHCHTWPRITPRRTRARNPSAAQLPALPVRAPYLAAHPRVEVAQRGAHVGEPEVPDPAVDEAAQPVPPAVERPPVGARQYLAHPVLERLDGLAVHAEAHLAATPGVERVPEVLDLPGDVRDEELVAVDPQKQPVLHVTGG